MFELDTEKERRRKEKQINQLLKHFNKQLKRLDLEGQYLALSPPSQNKEVEKEANKKKRKQLIKELSKIEQELGVALQPNLKPKKVTDETVEGFLTEQEIAEDFQTWFIQAQDYIHKPVELQLYYTSGVKIFSVKDY